MKRAFLLSVAAGAAASFAGSSFATTVSVPAPSLVKPTDTFSFAVLGFDSAGTNGVYLVSTLTGQFGTTLTLSGTGAGGAQTVTVTAAEALTGTTVTDSISVGVPSNFVPAGTTTAAGTAIQILELDLGGYNGGTNTIDFVTPVTSPTYAGSVNYGTGGASTVTLTPSNIAANSVFNQTNTSLYTSEGISTSSTAGFSQFAIRTFNFSISYSAVPEPSAYAAMAFGAMAFGGIAMRRKRPQA